MIVFHMLVRLNSQHLNNNKKKDKFILTFHLPSMVTNESVFMIASEHRIRSSSHNLCR